MQSFNDMTTRQLRAFLDGYLNTGAYKDEQFRACALVFNEKSENETAMEMLEEFYSQSLYIGNNDSLA